MANWKDYAKDLASGLRQGHRHMALLNRLRTVIRCQERAAEREYLALGRYYYNALRDEENRIAEDHCKRLDGINALLDSTLEALEKEVRKDEPCASCTGAACGGDGTIFHFGGGPFEITVKRDVVYHPEDEDIPEIEEIDLDGVESFDHDPMPEDFKPRPEEAGTEEEKPEFKGAELTENDSLPFEG